VEGSFEHDNESSGSIKGREFLDHLSNHHLLKNDSISWSYVQLLRYGYWKAITIFHILNMLLGSTAQIETFIDIFKSSFSREILMPINLQKKGLYNTFCNII
jgi:hypothetical protein